MKTSSIIVLLLPLAGCAAVNPRAGLGDLERLVSARTHLAVSWPGDDDAVRAADATVSTLLAAPLSAETAMRIALLNNRTLQALYHELGIAEAELAQAGLLPNPVLNANVRVGLGPSGTGTELGLVQDLIGVLQIPLKKRVAAAKLAEAKLDVADAVLALALTTKATFYRLQGAEQLLELRRQVVHTAEAARRVAERQHEAGGITDLVLATEQSLHEEAAAELAVAESTVVAQREDLNTLLGVWGERTAWTLEPRLAGIPADEIPAADDLETVALARRLDLEATRLRTQGERAQYRLGSFYGLIPSASLGTAAHREVDGGWSVGPALAIPIPLFDQSQAALAATASRVQAANERTAALTVQIRADVRRARTHLDAARRRARHYERAMLPLTARIVDETQREYNAMLVGVFQLLQARREQIETGRRYIEALTDYWVSRTELERSLGAELPRTIETAPTAMNAPPSDGPPTHSHHHHGG